MYSFFCKYRDKDDYDEALVYYYQKALKIWYRIYKNNVNHPNIQAHYLSNQIFKSQDLGNEADIEYNHQSKENKTINSRKQQQLQLTLLHT